MRLKKVLVTGGAGFLGSHLCEKLVNDGLHVVCVDKEWHIVSPLL